MSIFGALFASFSLVSRVSFAWHFPQNSRFWGFVGFTPRGVILCCRGASWHVVHSSWTWWDTAFVRAISPWHAEHSFGVVGGFGSWGLWQPAHGLSGLWPCGLICGKPLGRDGL